eukprot:scaffold33452_cov56-Isochrysis_galbana.AAC.1
MAVKDYFGFPTSASINADEADTHTPTPLSAGCQGLFRLPHLGLHQRRRGRRSRRHSVRSQTLDILPAAGLPYRRLLPPRHPRQAG